MPEVRPSDLSLDVADSLGSIYCATKHALRALSGSLLSELVNTPIRVCEIQPGKHFLPRKDPAAEILIAIRYGGDRILCRTVQGGPGSRG